MQGVGKLWPILYQFFKPSKNQSWKREKEFRVKDLHLLSSSFPQPSFVIRYSFNGQNLNLDQITLSLFTYFLALKIHPCRIFDTLMGNSLRSITVVLEGKRWGKSSFLIFKLLVLGLKDIYRILKTPIASHNWSSFRTIFNIPVPKKALRDCKIGRLKSVKYWFWHHVIQILAI